ncbi:putative ubiquitin conjugating factor [Reticulomyxa filosa]|uniref:RING-type E3 ubiquitin transferase n=1 Tax=Reticulomyxa filosa TaxID=46433 RepID=X6M6D5_RETFI|nr:putative ubiquitin conjugating factor [Reticulomyxa filosa]|eukprot:ETO09553.1 putative ubiquitin conjugating factor [Reticulomyxa filosa]
MWIHLHRIAEDHRFEGKNLEASNIPSHFLDPLMHTLMEDPVILPSSQVSVDRSTIVRHLLSNPFDPFTRAHLTESELIDNAKLKAEIEDFKKQCTKTNISGSEDGLDAYFTGVFHLKRSPQTSFFCYYFPVKAIINIDKIKHQKIVFMEKIECIVLLFPLNQYDVTFVLIERNLYCLRKYYA